MKRAMLLAGLLFSMMVGNVYAQEKKPPVKLFLKFNFEDKITGNGSLVTDSSTPNFETKWGKVVGHAGRTWMGKGGEPWKAQDRVKGRSGYAYSFGGNAQRRYIRIPYSKGLDFGKGDFSIAVWIKTVSAGTILKQTTTPPYWMLIIQSGKGPVYGKASFFMNDGKSKGTDRIDTKKAINDGNWHYLVLTAARNANATFYIDGTMDSRWSIKGRSGSLNSKGYIGIGGYGYGRGYFDGLIDSLRFYRGVLTKKEIVNLFNEGK